MSKKRITELSALEKPMLGKDAFMVRFIHDDEPYEEPPVPTLKQLGQFKRLGMSVFDHHERDANLKKFRAPRDKK